jgi:hypothetical protein
MGPEAGPARTSSASWVVVGDHGWAGGETQSNFSVDGTALVKDGKLTAGTAVAGR